MSFNADLTLDAESGLNLTLLNNFASPTTASLFVFRARRRSVCARDCPNGTEVVDSREV